MKKFFLFNLLGLVLFSACKQETPTTNNSLQNKVDQYAEFTLKTNIDHLSDNQKEMLLIFYDIADIMNDLFWKQAYGSKEEALSLGTDSASKEFIKLNYGPWDRLNGNTPFIDSVESKPLGANFYPSDITKDEFEAFTAEDKTSLYTIIRRDSNNNLKSIPYSEAFKNELSKAADLLKKAADLAEDPGLKKYLQLRSEALLSNEYQPSDMAWMDMKTNKIDFVVGPIENYEDRLYNYKAAFESFILIKDMEWSKKLDHYATLLPELQEKLPVDPAYKAETPGTNSDLGAYDVINYTGDCNAGSKTIAINLPNDPEVHKEKGSRRLQLKNAMEAKYEKILIPISKILITPEQQKNVTFNAFFENTMFHEVAHGIGVHKTITTGLSVRKAMKDKSSALEEGKADILGIYLVNELIKMGELDADIMNNYVTFTAGLFRSIRFGASSAHGIANLIRYNYFKEHNAFSRDESGIYTVNPKEMQDAINSLTEKIITIQGDGDYEAASKLVEDYGVISDELASDLEKINNNNIPVDIVFNQGPEILGLK